MADLAIVLALVALNAFAHASYVRWRRNRGKRRAAKPVAAARRAGLVYPTHPSPRWTEMPEHAAAIRPVGVDW